MAQCNDKRSKKQTAADDKPEQSLALECPPKKKQALLSPHIGI